MTIKQGRQQVLLGAVFLGLLLATVTVASCNTIRGAGRDVSAGGDAVSDAATETQREMARERARKDAEEARARRAAEQRAKSGS